MKTGISKQKAAIKKEKRLKRKRRGRGK